LRWSGSGYQVISFPPILILSFRYPVVFYSERKFLAGLRKIKKIFYRGYEGNFYSNEKYNTGYSKDSGKNGCPHVLPRQMRRHEEVVIAFTITSQKHLVPAAVLMSSLLDWRLFQPYNKRQALLILT
jgi:hypothetical protein